MAKRLRMAHLPVRQRRWKLSRRHCEKLLTNVAPTGSTDSAGCRRSTPIGYALALTNLMANRRLGLSMRLYRLVPPNPTRQPNDLNDRERVILRPTGRLAMNRKLEPCIYPRCDDGSEAHEPRFTYDTVCNSCRKRYGKLLGFVLMDYVTLKSSLGSPIRRPSDGSKHMAPKAKSFGHPAESDSDWAAMIADQLNELEHDLREHLSDGAAVHPRLLEVRRVQLAYNYLTNHFNDLCTHPAADDYAANLVEIHGKTRSRLGQTRFVQRLKTPCPSCDVVALVRSVGQIECGNDKCRRVIPEDHYLFWARILLDELVDAYDNNTPEMIGV